MFFKDPYIGKTFIVKRANHNFHPYKTGELVEVVDTDLGWERDCKVVSSSGVSFWISKKDWLIDKENDV